MCTDHGNGVARLVPSTISVDFLPRPRCYTDQPFLANGKGHNGRGIAGKVVFTTWLTDFGP